MDANLLRLKSKENANVDFGLGVSVVGRDLRLTQKVWLCYHTLQVENRISSYVWDDKKEKL